MRCLVVEGRRVVDRRGGLGGVPSDRVCGVEDSPRAVERALENTRARTASIFVSDFVSDASRSVLTPGLVELIRYCGRVIVDQRAYGLR